MDPGDRRPAGGWPDEDAALAMIREALATAEAPYVSVSGGKDSMVVAHLVTRVDPSVPMVHSTHGAGWLPEQWPDILLDALASMGATDVHWTDRNLIHAPDGGGFDLTLLGLRYTESQRRRKRMETVPRLNRRVEECWPIAWWTTEQVWAYTRSHDVPYLSLYEEGWRRTHWPETELDRGPWGRVEYRVGREAEAEAAEQAEEPVARTVVAVGRRRRKRVAVPVWDWSWGDWETRSVLVPPDWSGTRWVPRRPSYADCPDPIAPTD